MNYKMKNWLLVLIGLVITFIGVITKKFFFLFLIFPLSLLWKDKEDENLSQGKDLKNNKIETKVS